MSEVGRDFRIILILSGTCTGHSLVGCSRSEEVVAVPALQLRTCKKGGEVVFHMNHYMPAVHPLQTIS